MAPIAATVMAVLKAAWVDMVIRIKVITIRVQEWGMVPKVKDREDMLTKEDIILEVVMA